MDSAIGISYDISLGFAEGPNSDWTDRHRPLERPAEHSLEHQKSLAFLATEQLDRSILFF